MRNYLILKQQARHFRSDPDFVEAMTAAGWPTLAVATLSPGQKIAGLLADRSGHDDIDSATAGRREVNIERLDQLAVEHIFGVR